MSERTQSAAAFPTPSRIAALHPKAEERLGAYLQGIFDVLGTKRRREGFAIYACGILGEGERKSIEPIASRACGSPDETDAMHKKLLRFIAESEWEDRSIREYATQYAIEQMQVHGPIRHWIVDDTGFIKQGKFSPGVQRQYTGSAGKTTNCQVAVSLTLATDHAHVPVDMQLYLPESWAQDRPRCRAAKIPEDVDYRPKWVIGLAMIAGVVAAGLPRGVVLVDADYGDKSEFRDGLDALHLQYAVAVKKTTCVRRIRGVGNHRSVGERMTVEDLAFELHPGDIRKVTWRKGMKTTMSARFAIVYA